MDFTKTSCLPDSLNLTPHTKDGCLSELSDERAEGDKSKKNAAKDKMLRRDERERMLLESK